MGDHSPARSGAAATNSLFIVAVLAEHLLHRLEARLPGRATLDITVTFRQDFKPDLEEVAKIAHARGYQVLCDSLAITFADNQPVWRCAAVAIERSRALSPAMLAQELSISVGIARFSITPVRS